MKVYALDDDLDFLKLLNLKLHKIKLDGHVFSRPEDFLNMLKNDPPDLCLIDLNLDVAEGAGYQVIKAIRKKIDKKIIIFVVSKRNSPRDISFALEIGADDYLAKPLDFLLLQHKIETYFHLDNNHLQALPNYDVPSFFNHCDIITKLKPFMINEFEWVFHSSHFMARHTSIEVFGDVTKEIIGSDKLLLTVNNCQFLPEKKLFSIHCDLKELKDQEVANLRSWLLKTKK
jgi:DNA-binding response OmpR family regulator